MFGSVAVLSGAVMGTGMKPAQKKRREDRQLRYIWAFALRKLTAARVPTQREKLRSKHFLNEYAETTW